jgi:hypothetical protein
MSDEQIKCPHCAAEFENPSCKVIEMDGKYYVRFFMFSCPHCKVLLQILNPK